VGPDGRSLIDEVGELVITKPMPSMPLFFWNDPDGERYRDSYFDMYPGVWRHGDWIKITPHGSAVIYGRSDSTINRGGVRMGTSELYSAIEGVEAVQDSLVVDVDDRIVAFVVTAGELDDSLTDEIRRRVREHCSPRHVPDEIHRIDEVPRTLSNKKLEVPVKRILQGGDPSKVASRDSLANPAALDWFAERVGEITRAR
jgi:acetoacetyl-CoA synthetase